jgi:putative peptidoglycan lipid II flippase
VIYTLKLLFFSGIAIIPIHYLSPLVLAFFTNKGRIISYGVPLAINAGVYTIIGISILALARDKNLLALIRMIKRRDS